MPRRLPILPLRSLTRSVAMAAVVGLLALTSVLTAQPPTPPPGTPAPTPPAPGNPSTIRAGQKRNLEDYQNLTNELRKLAQRWKNSTDPQDKARAAIIEDALKKAEEKGVKNLFDEIIGGLEGKTDPSSGELAKLIQKDKALNDALAEIIAILESDDALTKLQKEIKETEKLIQEVKGLKLRQEDLNALTQRPNSDPNKLANKQGDLAKDTQRLADKLAGKKDDPNNKSADKSEEPKEGAKPGENASEAKPDSQQAKSNPQEGSGDQQPKPMGGMNDPKAGTEKPAPKEGPMGNMGEAKPQPKMPEAQPMEGQAKSPGDDNKSAAKPSDPKSGGEAKPSPSSPMMPSESQQGNSKSNPSPSSPSPSSPSQSKPNDAQNPNAKAQKNVQEAVPPQKGAEGDLNKNDKPNASKKEEQAVQSLEKALEELEKRLKQLREKEMAAKLEDLERRIEKMLREQRAVRAATGTIEEGVKKKSGMRDNADLQKSQDQANKENGIIVEANQALRLLEDEGSAVVFAGVLAEVKKDMESVRDRLNKGNTGEDTQLIEDQIIVQLERMLAAVKKAKRDLQNQPTSPPGDGSPPPDGNQELIKLVEQLKLLRDLQIQVNDRTALFGKKLQDGSQQATDPDLQIDLKKLAERQKTLQDMLHKIATGANK